MNEKRNCLIYYPKIPHGWKHRTLKRQILFVIKGNEDLAIYGE